MQSTIFENFLESYENNKERVVLEYKEGHHFAKITYQTLYELVFCFMGELKKLGVKKGELVGLISENRPEWVISDLALLGLGAVSVPIHKVLSTDQIAEILKETKPRILLISDEIVFEKIKNIKELRDFLEKIIYFEENKIELEKTEILYFKKITHENNACSEADIVKTTQDDLATVLYTSGTTGKAKGVMLTNGNLVSNAKALMRTVTISANDKFLSILPLSHIFERTVGYYVPLFSGAVISYIEDPKKFGEVVKLEKPSIVIAVPRLYEKVYEKIVKELNHNKIKKAIFYKAISVFNNSKANPVLKQLIDTVIFGKVKKELGGNIRFFVSGGAPLNKDVAIFFNSINLKVLEGYGLTETSPVISCNSEESICLGTVGKPIPETQVKIDSGEILAKGPGVMRGYFNNEQATKETFSGEWLKTGDLGEIDNNGNLKITGRIKDLIVLSTGKKVAPAKMEEELEFSKFISQALLIGDGYKYLTALIVPCWEEVLAEFGRKNKKELLKEGKLYSFFEDETAKILNHYAEHEKIKKFILLEEEFSLDTGEMTPTLKLRRHKILEKYKPQIKELYNE